MPTTFWPGGPEKLEDFLTPFMLAVGLGLLLWFVNVALTGKIASRKRRDDGAWAVAALFFGPLALLAVHLLPRNTKIKTEPPQVPSNDARGGWGEGVK